MPPKRRHGQQHEQPSLPQHEQKRAMDRIVSNPHLLTAVFDFLPAPAFALLPAVSRAFHATATAPSLDPAWARFARARWPAADAVLESFTAWGVSANGFCFCRVEEERESEMEKVWGPKEDELRPYHRASFLKLEMAHRESKHVLTLKLIPLRPEGDCDLMALFGPRGRDPVPVEGGLALNLVTTELDNYEKYAMTLSLMRPLGERALPEALCLVRSGSFEIGDMKDEDDGPNDGPWRYFSTYNGESVRPPSVLRLPDIYFFFYVREDEDEKKKRLGVTVKVVDAWWRGKDVFVKW